MNQLMVCYNPLSGVERMILRIIGPIYTGNNEFNQVAQTYLPEEQFE